MKTEETVFGPTKIFTNNYSNTPPSTKSRKNIAGKNFPLTALCFHEALNLILQILKNRHLAVQKSDYTAKNARRMVGGMYP